MKTLINYPVKVFVTGFIVLVFLSLLLFWIRLACESYISAFVGNISITPSGLVPPEYENDPNVVTPSRVSAYLQSIPIRYLGIADYIESRYPGGRNSNVYFLVNKNETWMYFDKESGKIIYFDTERRRMPDMTRISKKVQLYIGPEGVSEMPDKTLGKFIDPIIDRSWIYRMQWQLNSLILYDKILQRFFKINFNERTIVKGPEVPKNSSRKPIQIGYLKKEPSSLSISFSPPQIKFSGTTDDIYRQRNTLRPTIETDPIQDAGPYLLVLDESGRIDSLEKENLEFVTGTSAMPAPYIQLPAPQTYFGRMRHITPKNLLGYEVRPLTLNKYYDQDSNTPTFIQPQLEKEQTGYGYDREYFGMFVASVSDEGTSMAFAVINEMGQQINILQSESYEYNGRNRYTPSSEIAYWGTPWAPLSTICKYVTENVHPPILSIASIFSASSFEAGAGYRSLFLLPNSFAAMNARNGHGNIVERFLSSLLLIVPSIILSIWLAIRVKKDAIVTGLSENARFYWMLGTIAFGLAAFVTFKLTKPKIKLVTCSNCGQPRRPDMEKCHRCKSGWHVPELTPPNWRVLGAEN